MLGYFWASFEMLLGGNFHADLWQRSSDIRSHCIIYCSTVQLPYYATAARRHGPLYNISTR